MSDNDSGDYFEQTRRHINRLVEQLCELSDSDLPLAQYYDQFLEGVLRAIAAPAGAIWTRTPQGKMHLEYEINMQGVGLDSESEQLTHAELIETALKLGRPQLVPPGIALGTQGQDKASPRNPTRFVILLAPIMVGRRVVGLVEIWQSADRNPNAQHGFLQFITKMAELAGSFLRRRQKRSSLVHSLFRQIWRRNR
jgi:hypothetical protein